MPLQETQLFYYAAILLEIIWENTTNHNIIQNLPLFSYFDPIFQPQ